MPCGSLLFGDELDGRTISESAQSTDHGNSLVAQEAFVAELFASMNIADVNFNEWNSDSTQSVAQSDTGMRQTSGVDDNIIAFPSCLMDAIDDVAFMV